MENVMDNIGTSGAPGKGPLLPARAVWEHFGICDRTLDRWLESTALAFPRPTVIRKRRYWYLSDLEAWDLARAIEGARRAEAPVLHVANASADERGADAA
jgi:predicted DNA-binding transcriptional regulator AlpA